MEVPTTISFILGNNVIYHIVSMKNYLKIALKVISMKDMKMKIKKLKISKIRILIKVNF